jgi:pyruvate/2-oxoglutarate dehydrogenase complex dihydrolipoamide acyltransferase (E2) component
MGISDRWIAAVIAAGAIAAQTTGAAADSRIFSAKANVAGVTIDQAFRGDDALAVVGHGDGATLFRIDNAPATPVPCVNRLAFVTSTGERIERATDLCSLNWELTLEVKPPAEPAAAPPAAEPPAQAETTAPPAAPPADAAAPAPATAYTETVTITTDDPAAGIASVLLDHAPVTLKGLPGASVQIEVSGAADEGIACERNLEITLADGRRFNRDANICLNGWKVTVALGEGPGELTTEPAAPPPPRVATPASPSPGPAVSTQAPPPPAVSTQGPPPPAVSTQGPPPAQPPVAGAPAMAPGSQYVWSFNAAGDNAALILGIPETDAMAFIASCRKGSGKVSVRLPESAARVTPGMAVPITFSTATFVKTYPGVGSAIDELTGASQPMVEVPATDGLWSALIRDASLSIAVAPVPPTSVSLKGSAEPARQLVDACLVPVVQPPPVAGPPPGAPGITVGYACMNGGSLRVTYNGRQQTALVSEPGAPPMLLYFMPGPPPAQRYGNGPARLVNVENQVRWRRFGASSPPVICYPR